MSYKDIGSTSLHPFTLIQPLDLVHGGQAGHIVGYPIGTIQIVTHILVVFIQRMSGLGEFPLSFFELFLEKCRFIGQGIILALKLVCKGQIPVHLGLIDSRDQISHLGIIALDF